MKSHAQLIVLVAIVAISTVKAQDTLQVKSLRTIDVCSGAKRWLISASLGTIRFADSLESFDITIGYDRRVLRPTDVLKEGTLSAQMSNGPTMNVIVPGEMRIFGFNVARSVAGSVPLIAVAGDFLGSCDDRGVLTVPYPPDFNGEFKRNVTVLTGDIVTAVAVTKNDATAGCRFSTDSLRITDVSESTTFGISIEPYKGSTTERIIEIQGARESDTVYYRITDVRSVDNCRVDSMVRVRHLTKAYVTVDSNGLDRSSSLTVSVGRSNVTTTTVVDLVGSLVHLDSCSCVRPLLSDTVSIKISPIVSSVLSSVDEHTCTVNVRNDNVTGECDHQQMKNLEIFDLYGRRIRGEVKANSTSVEISTDNLPSGILFVRLQCGRNQTVKTIVK